MKVRHITHWNSGKVPDKFKDATEVTWKDTEELCAAFDVAFVHTPGSGPDPAIWLDNLGGRFRVR